MANNFYVIFADGSVDGIEQGLGSYQKHKNDLKKMGCEVKAIGPIPGQVADEIEDMANNGKSFAVCKRYANENSDLNTRLND